MERIIKNGWINFWRHFWLSSATISVMVLMLLVVSGLLVLNVATQTTVSMIQDKVDISVYFETFAEEKEILELRDSLLTFEEVKSVDYVSRQEALDAFKARHKDNQLILNALKELDDNPLEAVLNIKAYQASQYEAISQFLETGSHNEVIDKVNYRENEELISRLFSITNTTKKIGLGASLLLGLVALLVMFNTIRITIYSRRDEISIMRLIGASSWFIRGPFLVQGALIGIISASLSLVVTYTVLAFITEPASQFIPGLDLFDYFVSNALFIIGGQILFGMILGALSSFVAVRKYLKV